MKKINTLDQKHQCYKETDLCLRAIESLIKTSTFRSVGCEMLNKLDSNQLIPDHKVVYLYLYGRYYSYTFRQTNEIENLELANDFYDEVMQYAYEQKIKIKDFKFFYSRAYTKFKLAQLVWDAERKPWLLQKAVAITNRALAIDNQNDSFLWLQEQLQA
jgi:hypothetical protein